MWNDTDIPLPILITFRCYGTWVHGDERGSVDREHRRYKTPYAPANQKRRRHSQAILKSEPVLLNAAQRSCVERRSMRLAHIATGNCLLAVCDPIMCTQSFRLGLRNRK